MWVAQRLSGAILALFVLVHLATLIYAVRHGLSAEAILGRTRGSFLAAGFYGLFVLAVAVHAPLGLRAVCEEWLGWRKGLAPVLVAYALAILLGGLRAVYALVGRA
jgi:fumarate reductase subunit C